VTVSEFICNAETIENILEILNTLKLGAEGTYEGGGQGAEGL